MNLATILKFLGVKVTSEQIAQLEIVIPQIPARAVEIIKYVNLSVSNFESRLGVLEQGQNRIIHGQELLLLSLKKLEERGDNVRDAGVGANQDLLEAGEFDQFPSKLDGVPNAG